MARPKKEVVVEEEKVKLNLAETYMTKAIEFEELDADALYRKVCELETFAVALAEKYGFSIPKERNSFRKRIIKQAGSWFQEKFD